MASPMKRERRGRGEGCLYQRPDGLWVGSVSLGYAPNGRRLRKVVYGKTKGEAAQEMRKVQHGVDIGVLPMDRSALTVATWCEHWLKCVGPTVEPGTFVPYRAHVRRFIAPRFGHWKLAELRRTVCQEFYAHLLRDGVSAPMVRKIGTTLVAALNAAVAAGEQPANPAARLKNPKAERRPLQVFTPEQAAAIVMACEAARLGPMFLLMLDAGTGPGETWALTWGDIDTDRRTVRVVKSLEEIAGKCRIKVLKAKHRNRTVIVGGATAAALVAHKERMRDGGKSVAKDALVFCGGRFGGVLRSTDVRRDDWLPLLGAAGVPHLPMHALRHAPAHGGVQPDGRRRAAGARVG